MPAERRQVENSQAVTQAGPSRQAETAGGSAGRQAGMAGAGRCSRTQQTQVVEAEEPTAVETNKI